MMIFIAAIELLDGCRMFLNDKHSTMDKFVGCDSSFQFYLIKRNNGRKIRIKDIDGKVIDELEKLELAKCILKISKIFYNNYCGYLDDRDFAKEDLKNAIKDFVSSFGLDEI